MTWVMASCARLQRGARTQGQRPALVVLLQEQQSGGVFEGQAAPSPPLRDCLPLQLHKEGAGLHVAGSM